jgi:hypothetical protein
LSSSPISLNLFDVRQPPGLLEQRFLRAVETDEHLEPLSALVGTQASRTIAWNIRSQLTAGMAHMTASIARRCTVRSAKSGCKSPRCPWSASRCSAGSRTGATAAPNCCCVFMFIDRQTWCLLPPAAPHCRCNAGGVHPRATISFGTYVRNVSMKGLPSDDGSQFASGTPATGFGPTAIFKEPSDSFCKGD